MDRLTAYQIADAFPEESKQYLPKILEVFESKTLAYKEMIKDINDKNLDIKTKKLYINFIKMTIPIRLKDDLIRYKKVLQILKDKELSLMLERKKVIEKAKTVPIEDLYQFEKIKVMTNKISACCPIHKEKNPSFYIYKESNSFHCFSCKASGDSISFLMKLHNITFSKALDMLK